jgi:hypothetical protein
VQDTYGALNAVEFIDSMGCPCFRELHVGRLIYHSGFVDIIYAYHSKYGLVPEATYRSFCQAVAQCNAKISDDTIREFSRFMMRHALGQMLERPKRYRSERLDACDPEAESFCASVQSTLVVHLPAVLVLIVTRYL